MKTTFNNKVIAVLLTFSKYELNRFKKMVASPFFNENQVLLELLEVYMSNLKKHQMVPYSKEQIWRFIDSKHKYNDTKFRRLNSDLLKLTESFLMYIALEKQPTQAQNLLLKEIKERSIDKMYNGAIKQAKSLQNNNEKRDAKFYHDAYVLELELAAIQERTFKRSDESNIDALHKNLDYFYLGEKLKQYCSLLNLKEVVSVDFEPMLIEEILEHLQKHTYENIPSIEVYHKILLCLKDENNAIYYTQFCQYLNQHADYFLINEARTLYGMAQNYCIKKINTGHPQYLEELFKLYQTVLDKKIIFHQETLSPWDYKNIVTVGIRIEAYDWIENFIVTYKESLPKNYQENAYTYNLAKLYFNKRDFDKVIQLLLTVEYQDIFYQLDSKTLLLKTYYELDEEEALHALLDSFKVLLSRKKVVTSAYKSNYMNLVKHTRKLMDARNGKMQKLTQLKVDIETDSNVADLGWLKAKIGELE